MSDSKNKKELIQKARGMNDIFSREYFAKEKMIEKAKNIASFYGFNPIQTPHLEKIDLFSSTLGESTDVIEKEMYSLKTKGGNKLVLRPELTAPIMRAYIEHGMQSKPQPVMLYSHGACFRHDKPQKGRRREFQQFDLEILGEKDSIADATIIKVALAILEEAIGIKSISVRINSIGCKECRETYKKELTSFYKKKTKEICKDCERRLKVNPLRLLDCKKEQCIKEKENCPQLMNHLCGECTSHLKDLLETLDASETPYYLDSCLVRGLDYYSRTVFEFFSEENNLELGGGGRYDFLSEILGNKNIPAVGMAIGIDRAIDILSEKNELPKIPQKQTKVFFIQLGAEAKHKSFSILEALRKAKIPTKHSLNKDSLKSQLKIASKLKVPYAIIFGQKEAIEGTVIIRDMDSVSQETIPLSGLVDFLKKKMK